MKKLALVATATALVLVGCNSVNPDVNNNQVTTVQPHGYECQAANGTDRASLMVNGMKNNDIISVTVNVPTLSLNNQTIELKSAVSGSGERYMNDKNPASTYEWHTKGGEGVFSVMAGGQEFNYLCQQGSN